MSVLQQQPLSPSSDWLSQLPDSRTLAAMAEQAQGPPTAPQQRASPLAPSPQFLEQLPSSEELFKMLAPQETDAQRLQRWHSEEIERKAQEMMANPTLLSPIMQNPVMRALEGGGSRAAQVAAKLTANWMTGEDVSGQFAQMPEVRERIYQKTYGHPTPFHERLTAGVIQGLSEMIGMGGSFGGTGYLASMGVSSYDSALEEGRLEGMGTGEAHAYAAVNAAADVITEKIFMGQGKGAAAAVLGLKKNVGKFLWETFKTAGEEGTEEVAAQLIQNANKLAHGVPILDENGQPKPWYTAIFDGVGEAGAIGAATGAVAGAGAKYAEHRLQPPVSPQTIPPNAGQPQGATPTPAAGQTTVQTPEWATQPPAQPQTIQPGGVQNATPQTPEETPPQVPQAAPPVQPEGQNPPSAAPMASEPGVEAQIGAVFGQKEPKLTKQTLRHLEPFFPQRSKQWIRRRFKTEAAGQAELAKRAAPVEVPAAPIHQPEQHTYDLQTLTPQHGTLPAPVRANTANTERTPVEHPSESQLPIATNVATSAANTQRTPTLPEPNTPAPPPVPHFTTETSGRIQPFVDHLLRRRAEGMSDADALKEMGIDRKPMRGPVVQEADRQDAVGLTTSPQGGIAPAAAPPPATKPETKPESLPEATVPPEKTAEAPDVRLARAVAARLKTDQRSLPPPVFFKMADEAYGGTRAEGKYGPSDAYDALETGINLAVKEQPAATTLDEEKARIKELQDLIARVPSQTNRSGEKDLMQQFSTPPAYANAVTWLANITPEDTVLEPSAGTGSIAVHALNAGATVYGNDLSKRRAALLEELGLKQVFNEDAEQIQNTLPNRMPRPTVIVMNPPFSRAAARMGDKRVIGTDLKHIDAALKLLADGGRLVAIVGAPLHGEVTQTFASWFRRTIGDYNIRANVSVGRDVYKGYGTTFPTQVLVIDKTGPTTDTIVGEVPDATGLVEKLEPIRARTGVQQERPGVGLPRPAEGRAPEPRPEPTVRPATGPVVPAEPRGGTAGPGEALPQQPRGQRAGNAGVAGPDRGGGVPESTANRPTAAPRQPDRGSQPEREATGKPPERAAVPQPPAETPTSPSANPLIFETPEGKRPTPVASQTDGAGPQEVVFEPYAPAKVKIKGAQAHPGSLVESAAMAAVDPPDSTYAPKIPQELIDSGALSAAQLETPVYAGQAHEQFLELRNEQGQALRRGHMNGDGTGVGKARQAASIILDNFQRGRTRAVWMSVSQKLYEDAREEWEALGQQKDEVVNLSKMKPDEPIKLNRGILYATYGTLIKQAQKSKKRRVDQIIEWLGEDFDGVLIFDEAHKMGNALPTRGARGVQQGSLTAATGLELQRRLPNARVEYLTATAATEVANLAFAERLGIWGPNTEFADASDFVNKVASGGLAAMEMVARDLKAMGAYLSRSLSFNDGTPEGTVEFDRIEHRLTEDQTATWDKLSDGWAVVHGNVDKALQVTESDGRAKGAAEAQFQAAQQRFFNQVITAMSLPSMIDRMEKDLSANKSILIQITNTNEAALDRALADRSEETELEDMDTTPRDILVQYVKNAFPVQQMEQYEDEDGNTRSRPAVDSAGNAIINQEAAAMRDKLLDELGSLNVPESPLDQIVSHFGEKKVAEVTGRSQRLVKNKEGKLERQTRGAAANKGEIADFMDDKKRILIFSQAGGTGASYHASLRHKNQRKREHYVLQPGWSAPAALQGMGRSHRSNQKQAPFYHLVHTDLKGQKRFISSIARRLAQLGAISKGQREAGDAGLFSPADNLESQQAKDGLYNFYRDLYQGDIDGITIDEFERITGLRLRNSEGGLRSDLPPITKFLNRVLALPVGRQNDVFAQFEQRLNDQVDRAIAEGTLDLGIESIRHDKIEKKAEKTVYEDKSGAKTKYVHLQTSDKTKPTTWEGVNRGERLGGKKPQAFVQSSKGKVYAIVPGPQKTDTRTGRVEEQYRLADPMGYHYTRQTTVDYGGYERLTEQEAERLWNEAVAKAPKMVTHDLHLITGAMLPIWSRVTGTPRVKRLTTDEGETMLGRVVSEDELDETLANLGVKQEHGAAKPEDVAKGNATVKLGNGWYIKPVRVQGEERLELIGPDFRYFDELEQAGIFRERIGGKVRFFIPNGDQAAIEKIIRNRPIVETEWEGKRSEYRAPRQPGQPPAVPQVQLSPDLNKPTVVSNIEATRKPLEVEGSIKPEPGEKVSVENIRKTLEHDFDTALLRDRVRPGAQGFYDWATNVGRLVSKQYQNLAIIAHEVGHHFQNVSDVTAEAPADVQAEWESMDYDPDRQDPKEGFAEFVRMLLTTEAAPAMAPKSYEWFTQQYLQNHPEDLAKFSKARRLIDDYRNQDPLDRARSQMFSYGEHAKPLEVSAREEWKDEIERRLINAGRNFYDEHFLLKRLAEQAETKLGPGYTAAVGKFRSLVEAYFGADQTQAIEAMTDGVYTLGEERKKLGNSLKQVLAPLSREEFETWAPYLSAVAAKESRARKPGYNPGISVQDQDAIIAEVKRQGLEDKFDKVNKAFREYHANLVRILADSGVISQESAERIINSRDVYMPRLRIKDKGLRNVVSGAFQDITRSVFGVKNPVRRLGAGSNDPYMDPIEATILRTMEVFNAANHQEMETAFMKLMLPTMGGAKGFGKWVVEVDPKRVMETYKLEQMLDSLTREHDVRGSVRDPVLAPADAEKIKKVSQLRAGKITKPLMEWFEDNMGLDLTHPQAIKNALAMTDNVPDLADAVAIWRSDFGENPSEHVKRFYVNGEVHLAQYVDGDLYREVQGLSSRSEASTLGKALSAVLRGWDKYLTTPTKLGAVGLNPSFTLVNFMRDYASFITQSKETGPWERFWAPFEGLGRYGADYVRSAMTGVRNPYAELFDALVGKTTIRLGSRRKAVKHIKGELIAKTPGEKLKAKFAWGNIVNSLQDLMSIPEAAVRLPEFMGSIHNAGYHFDYAQDNWVETGTGKKIDALPRRVVTAAASAANEVTTNFRRKGIYGRVGDRMIPFFSANIAGAARGLIGAKELLSGPGLHKRQLGMAMLLGFGAIAWALGHDDDWYKDLDPELKNQYWFFGLPDGTPFLRIPKPHTYAALVNMLEGIGDWFHTGKADRFGPAAKTAITQELPPWRPAGLSTAWEVYMNEDRFGRKIEPTSQVESGIYKQYRTKPYTTETAKFLSKFLSSGRYGISPVQADYIADQWTGGTAGQTIPLLEGKSRLETLPVLRRFLLKSDHQATVEKFYGAYSDLQSAVATAKFLNPETKRPDAVRQAQLEQQTRYKDVLSDIWKADKAATIDERRELERYAVGLADYALGNAPRELYPNPLQKTTKEQPAVIEQARTAYISKLGHHLTASPQIKLGEKFPQFKERFMLAAVERKWAAQELKRLGYSPIDVAKALQAQAIKHGQRLSAESVAEIATAMLAPGAD